MGEPLFSWWSHPFWNMGTLPQTTTVNTIRQDNDWQKYPTNLDILVKRRGIDINLFWILLTTINFTFSEKLVNFKFFQIFSSSCCLYGTVMMRLDPTIYWFLNRSLTVLAIPVCMPKENLWMNFFLIVTWYIHNLPMYFHNTAQYYFHHSKH